MIPEPPYAVAVALFILSIVGILLGSYLGIIELLEKFRASKSAHTPGVSVIMGDRNEIGRIGN